MTNHALYTDGRVQSFAEKCLSSENIANRRVRRQNYATGNSNHHQNGVYNRLYLKEVSGERGALSRRFYATSRGAMHIDEIKRGILPLLTDEVQKSFAKDIFYA